MNSTFKMVLSLSVVFLLFFWGYRRGIKGEKGFGWIKSRHSQYSSITHSGANKSLLQHPNNRFLTGKSSFLLNGVPTQIDVYTSNRSIGKEISKYEKKWRSKGLKVIERTFANMHIVSGLDENLRSFECAIMMPDPSSKKTLVIPAKLDLSRPPVKSGYKTPLYPLAQPLFHIESTDMGVYSENIIFLSDANVSSISDFYTNILETEGWHLAQPGKNSFVSPNSQNFLFLKGSDELWVNASRLEDENKTFVYLLYNDRL